jgi:uncharacterized protein (DUF2235 family)
MMKMPKELDKKPKKLLVFCDGTWNKTDKITKDGLPCPTNVIRLFEATLCYDDKGKSPQIVHYIDGVGTRKMERIIGGAFGYGISNNIKDGYRFIVSNYNEGDEIFLFGFSRGAFAARSLAGLIHNLGILRREKIYLINEVYKKYQDISTEWHPDGSEAKKFCRENTWGDENKKIKFLGVWDTVGALGTPYGIVTRWIMSKLFKYKFHNVKLSSSIESACHALAIDERRWPFRPNLWELSASHDPKKFEQKWFPGVHSNVGGGYCVTGLSDLALKWIADKAKEHGLHVNLGLISNPSFEPYHRDKCIKEAIDSSQIFFYRLATLLFTKLPSYIGLVSSEDKPFVQYIRWNGDYLRPILNKGNVGDFVGDLPLNSNPKDYVGDISLDTICKVNLKENPPYQPLNVL